ncbi:MAG: DEAD/DEAH box helicase [Gammaproteobacteria bacterium]|nr:DEAD/DEAH box helicase [Gammaproteobacteria bacterium]
MLSIFHPEIRRWFADTYAAPTEVQIASWPRIASDAYVLITALTGSGKILTAFLWCINRFYRGDWETGRIRALYISPLKALNNDIRVNLTEPRNTLRSNYGMRPVRTGLRSGDTDSGDRQRLLRHPPDILITTPESLHLMLTTTKGRMALATVECVIVDEIHALVNNRHGAQLAVALERLVNVAGEFQRVSLSATVHPLDAVAHWIAGRNAAGANRAIEIINAGQSKQIALSVSFPEEAQAAINNGEKIWEPLAHEFRNIIHHNRSTLFFTNSRRLAEKMLLRCPADTLKLDRTLVARLGTDRSALELASELCNLGRRFNLRTVGVGVETEAQLNALLQAGCNEVQGYLLSMPVPLEDFQSFLRQRFLQSKTGTQ